MIDSLIARVQGWFVDPGMANTFEVLATEVSSSIAGVWIAVAVLGLIVGSVAVLAGNPRLSKRHEDEAVATVA